MYDNVNLSRIRWASMNSPGIFQLLRKLKCALRFSGTIIGY